MADVTQYITKEAQRWDNVAHAAYGKGSLFQDIIEANPGIPVTAILPTGTVLNIPVKEDGIVTTDKEKLPPWKA
jgi:hypothetical protein